MQYQRLGFGHRFSLLPPLGPIAWRCPGQPRLTVHPPCSRNQPGDREKALAVLLPVVEQREGVAPDLYCMCGRVYKDMFISSNFTDTAKRDQSLHW